MERAAILKKPPVEGSPVTDRLSVLQAIKNVRARNPKVDNRRSDDWMYLKPSRDIDVVATTKEGREVVLLTRASTVSLAFSLAAGRMQREYPEIQDDVVSFTIR